MKSKFVIGLLLILVVLLFTITIFLAVLVLDSRGIIHLAEIKEKLQSKPAAEHPVAPSHQKAPRRKTEHRVTEKTVPNPNQSSNYKLQILVYDNQGKAIPHGEVSIPSLQLTGQVQNGRWISAREFPLKKLQSVQPTVSASGYQMVDILPPAIHSRNRVVQYKVTMKKITAGSIALHLKLKLGTWGLLAPLQLKQGNEKLAIIDKPEKEVMLPRNRLAAPLRLEGNYYQPVAFQVDPSQPRVTIQLKPNLVTVQVRDSLGIYADKLANVQVAINGMVLQKTNARGEALVPVPQFGVVKFTFHKPGVFPKQQKTVVIRNPQDVVTVALIPTKHHALIKFVDDRKTPIANEMVEITGQRLSLQGKTDQNGVFRLSHWYLRPDVTYRVRFPRLHIERRDLTIAREYFNTDKAFAYIVPLRFDCLVEADVPDARIEIINAKGERVSNGVGKLSVSLPQGSYKIIAERNGVKYTRVFDPRENPTVTIRTSDIVEYLQERIKQGYHPTKEEYQELWNYPTDGPHYVESLYMAGTLAMENKEFIKAYQAFNRYLIANPQAQYDVIFLIRFAETALEVAKGGSAQNRINMLEKARQQLLTAQTFYKEKITIKKRREVALRIFADLAEVNFELFNLYKELDNFNYERAARDTREAIEAFNLRYQAAENENGYEVGLFKKQYLRLVDIHEALDMAY